MVRRVLGSVLLVLGVALLLLGLGMAGRYLWVEEQSGDHTQAAMEQLMEKMENRFQESDAPEVPAEDAPQQPVTGETTPLRVMEELVIDGVPYIGYLEIPALELQLPVIGESGEEHLEIAPCRYFGTVFQKDFVIGGHRYRRHFRKLHTLGYGDQVIFTDVTGARFPYRVEELEVIEPYESAYLCSGGWDLSLYTCTTGGTSRLVVRCMSIDG